MPVLWWWFWKFGIPGIVYWRDGGLLTLWPCYDPLIIINCARYYCWWLYDMCCWNDDGVTILMIKWYSVMMMLTMMTSSCYLEVLDWWMNYWPLVNYYWLILWRIEYSNWNDCVVDYIDHYALWKVKNWYRLILYDMMTCWLVLKLLYWLWPAVALKIMICYWWLYWCGIN